jgi:dephospho-CoA kinase
MTTPIKKIVEDKTLIIGLTGGIGSGKSTVSRMFEALGARVVDADLLAREVVQPGQPAWREIKKVFGPKVINPDQTINRKALADLVFNDPIAIARLNRMTHPRIYKRMRSEVLKGRKEGVPAVILDIPLLLEAPQPFPLDLTIVVYCPKTLQIKRVRERNKVTREEVKQRLRNQMPIARKRKLADIVIDNRGTVQETRKQVRVLWDRLIKKTGREKSRPASKF